MDKVEKVKVLSELFELVNLFYVARDMPSEETDLYEQVERCCRQLDLDYDEVKRVFGLNPTL